MRQLRKQNKLFKSQKTFLLPKIEKAGLRLMLVPELRQRVYKANMDLPVHGLVKFYMGKCVSY